MIAIGSCAVLAQLGELKAAINPHGQPAESLFASSRVAAA